MKKKYEVVISGLAGRFPESESTEDLYRNLLEKKNLITDDDRRWKKDGMVTGIPNGTGKINDRDSLDSNFFGIHRRLCEVTDPHHRISLELAFAAVLDAGINPNDLWGSNTAVVAASVTSETEYEILMGVITMGLAILGHNRALQANRISYCLNLCGPSLMVDSSWNGGLDALYKAAEMVERGSVRSAIVVSCSVMYSAEVSYHYQRMGRLTSSNQTKSFSDDADGYNRSEGVVAYFLQRKEDALRIYGTPYVVEPLLKGSKSEPFTESSKEVFTWYLRNFYSKSGIDPKLVSYLEADGAASKVLDGTELNALSEVMLPGRKTPLLVGSVKSNLGHAEGASSGVSLAKVLLAANYGIIPPNINYTRPNSNVPALKSGQMQVLTEAVPLHGDYMAVNSISSIAAISHVVIKRHDKVKKKMPEKNVLPPDGLPRLLLVSGRNEDRLKEILTKIEKEPIDEEYVALVNNVFKKGIKKHSCRAYTVLNDKLNSCTKTKSFFTDGQQMQPVWWVFTGMGSQWPGMGTELMKLPVFARAIHKCHEILKPKGLDLIHIITTPDPKIYDNILYAFVGIAAVQIGLVDVLRELGLEPDGIVGHSVGELGCAYADGCFTAEQMILAAYARGKASIEVELIQGMMAAVGVGYKKIKFDVPEGIEVACHNSADSCTLSGPTKIMEKYIAQLKGQGVFAKLVNVANIAYHSKYIKPAAPALLKYLKEVVPDPKLRSSKWISSSVPEKDWGLESAKYCSAEYHTNNLLGSVLFEEASVHIPRDAIIVEIAPHGLLQAILKKAFPHATHIPLTNRAQNDGNIFLFNALGMLYLEGASLEIDKLYPPVEFPVSRGTRTLSNLVTWDHTEKWRINMQTGLETYEPEDINTVKPRTLNIHLKEKEFKYLSDHVIYDQIAIPFSFYLVEIFKTYQQVRKSTDEALTISNVTMSRHVELLKGITSLYVAFCTGSENWEVCLEEAHVASGQITFQVSGPTEVGSPSVGTVLTSEQVYDYLSHLGHQLGPKFRLIKSATLSLQEVSAVVQWTGDLVTFLDNVLKVPALLEIGENQLKLVTSMNYLTVDFSIFKENEIKDVLVTYNSLIGLLVAEGLQILYPVCDFPETKEDPERKVLFEKFEFQPYLDADVKDLHALLELSIKILMNNIHEAKSQNIVLSIIEIQGKLNIHDQINDVLKWMDEVEINIKIAGTDSNLDGYIANPEREYCFIITGSEELENATRVLTSSRGGLILLKGVEPPSDLAVIFHVTIEGQSYYLCNARRPFRESPPCVLMTSKDWKTQLKVELLKSSNRIVYVIGQEISLSSISNTVKDCSKLFNSHLLRFIFIDTDIYEFDLGKHKEQFEKDLKVNILRAGRWGIVSTQPINLESSPRISTQVEYLFSEISFENLGFPEAISLNLSDIAGFNKKKKTFEYSAISCGEKVCGLAKYTEVSRTLHPDPVLQWKVPEGWSHQEACSVLVPYAMAFCMIYIDEHFRSFNVDTISHILIHQGLLPVSQAAIRISLQRGWYVYVSYKNQEEKQKIKELFPEIPDSNLINTQNQQYHLDVLNITKNFRMNLVINTFPEKDSLSSCVACLGCEGVLFNLSERIMQKDNKIGMYIFLNQACVKGMSPSIIMDRSEADKIEIHRLIEEGFQTGLIKPFPKVIVPSSTTIGQVLSLNSDPYNLDKKIIIQMTEKSACKKESLYTCHLSRSYAILADRRGFWIDLMAWLVGKAARSFHIVISNDLLTGFTIERLSKMKNSTPYLSVVLISDSRVRNVEDVEKFILNVQQTVSWEAVFFVGERYSESIDYFSEALKEGKLVVLCEGADVLCEKRTRAGLPTLAVSVTQDLLKPYIVIPRLEQLMNMDVNSVIITEKTINHEIGMDVENSAISQHLPSTVNEIINLGEGSEEAGWREVRTKCPPSRSAPELPPVFIIPPLKKGQLDPIIRLLYYPAFMAVLPRHFQDFEDLAEQLHQGLHRFNTGVFTVICSDWSWIVGLLLGKLLEAEGKEVSLIFFESYITWESPSIFQQVRLLVNNDITMNGLSDQEKNKLAAKIEAGFQNLSFRLSLFTHELPEVKQKLNGICHYIRPKIALEDEKLTKIQEHCKRPVNVFVAEDVDILKIVQNRKLATYVNTFILFEYKDAANKAEKIFLKDGFLINPRLSCMNFVKPLEQARSKAFNANISNVTL